MMSLTQLRKQVRAAAKEAAYSPVGRVIARGIDMSPDIFPGKRLVASSGLDDYVRRLASESLPAGWYYAKLTIGRWRDWEGKTFNFLHGKDTIFSATITPNFQQKQLVYQNIIVNTDQASEFALDIDVPYVIAISRGEFTTPAQRSHDEKYRVVRRNGINYALRGNLKNPRSMIVVFPEHGAPSDAIAYRVNPLSGLSDDVLKNTVVVSLQDRYLQNGSYLTVDSSGKPLSHRLAHLIKSLRDRYGIADREVMFTGRRAGGSMAILHAKGFPESTLVVVEPDLNAELPSQSHGDGPIMYELLAAYLKQGRKVDYFSRREGVGAVFGLAQHHSTLTIYRMSGAEAAVSKAINFSQNALYRQFLGEGAVGGFSCEEVRIFPNEGGVQLQLRVDMTGASLANGIWFIEGRIGRATFRQLISGHSLPFVKYTSSGQHIFSEFDGVSQVSTALFFSSDGTRWRGDFPTVLERSVASGIECANDCEGVTS